MSKIFLDTNVLVYAYDESAATKKQRARALIDNFDGINLISVVSTQVMQELYNTLTRKLKLSSPDAAAELRDLLLMEVVILTPDLILAAADLHASASLSFWDSLIIAAAQSAHCDELWTEDLQTGRLFGTLKIVNPFLPTAPTPTA